jgi:hypothetical protein
VCASHGAKAPQVKAAAAERVRQAEIVEAARVYSVPREIEPALGLLEEICRTAGTISWLGEIVAGLKQQDIVFGRHLGRRGARAQPRPARTCVRSREPALSPGRQHVTARRIVWTALDSIVPAPSNPKKHDVQRIRRSLARYGVVEPPAVDERTGRLVP